MMRTWQHARIRERRTMKGTYVMLIELQDDEVIEVGSLGKREFPSGYYAYVGSAQAGIEQRVSRHKALNKKRRWHIDYLLQKAEVLATMAIPFGDKSMECEVAKKIGEVADCRVDLRGFGSSDCSCSSHLFYVGEREMGPAAFEAVYHTLSVLRCVHPSRTD
jgi:sugar fermentation stimulation protein A